MGIPAIGQVVLVPFPFSDLSHTKMRPAVVLAEAGRDDWMDCEQGEGHEFLHEATQVKNIWVPTGSRG